MKALFIKKRNRKERKTPKLISNKCRMESLLNLPYLFHSRDHRRKKCRFLRNSFEFKCKQQSDSRFPKKRTRVFAIDHRERESNFRSQSRKRRISGESGSIQIGDRKSASSRKRLSEIPRKRKSTVGTQSTSKAKAQSDSVGYQSEYSSEYAGYQSEFKYIQQIGTIIHSKTKIL